MCSGAALLTPLVCGASGNVPVFGNAAVKLSQFPLYDHARVGTRC